MRRKWLMVTAFALAVLVVVLGLGWILVPRAVQNFFYPPAPAMPAAVPETVETLLAQYERLLHDRSPKVLAATNPGLSDAQIDALEKKHQFTLPHDLRALYRWRNGTSDRFVDTFADHRLVPLEEALAQRDALAGEVGKQGPFQRAMIWAFIGHRKGWLGVIVDASGDGCHFDPQRSESEGSFFFCFAEDMDYVFFPTFRNFLAATLEGQKSGVLGFGPQGAGTVDFERTVPLWDRYGSSNVR
jgi:cell wall assembly regulator SMI1